MKLNYIGICLRDSLGHEKFEKVFHPKATAMYFENCGTTHCLSETDSSYYLLHFTSENGSKVLLRTFVYRDAFIDAPNRKILVFRWKNDPHIPWLYHRRTGDLKINYCTDFVKNVVPRSFFSIETPALLFQKDDDIPKWAGFGDHF